MQTSRQRPKRASQPAAAAFSPAAAKLINQIQEDARAQLLAELSTKDAIVVLHSCDPDSRRVECNGETLTIRDRKGYSLRMYRRHTMPESWLNNPNMHDFWHPARWNGTECRVDSQGREWDCSTGIYVCDDFGQLVQVAE